MRRLSLPVPVVLALLLTIGFFSRAFAGDPPADRNVVVIVSDDHGQDLGAYGNPVIQTPHLDALASEGTLFRHAFATTASCSASRSVIMTGLHNHRNGQYGHVHDYAKYESYEYLETLPVLMSKGGYRTAIVGKYHVAPRETYKFDQFLDAGLRNTVEMANAAEDLIASGSDQPFFLYYATGDPHRGGGNAEELPHAPDRFGNMPEGESREGIDPVRYDPDEVIVPEWLPDNSVTRAELAQYYQSVSRVDQGVGRLIDLLKENGEYENTLIIYMSDHGIAFPGAKTTTYEPGLKSPLIVRHPDAEQRGIESDALINWVDITPTILDFAGVEPPTYEQHIHNGVILDLFPGLPEEHGLHGDSFLSIVDREHAEGWDEVFASHTFHEIQMYYPMRVVRDRQYKLIWNIAHGLEYPFASDLWTAPTWQHIYEQGMDATFGVRTVDEYINRPEFELYDIQEDPYEADNLADEPGYQDVLKRYKEKIRNHQLRTSDPWVMKWAYE